MKLEDPFGRQFPYLRLSVTPRCNFRCGYCLPEGFDRSLPENYLTEKEIYYLVKAWSGLGLEKIRLTGGEPTLRKDFSSLAQTVSQFSNIKYKAFTTNGHNLARKAQEYYDAGLNYVNVSIDSLNPQSYHQITKVDCLNKVLKGIDKARSVGFKVKVNAVLLKGVNDRELDHFISWSQKEDIDVRFIELMLTGDAPESYLKQHQCSSDLLLDRLREIGWLEQKRGALSGPARMFHPPSTTGKTKGGIGVIAPYSKDFCKGCNRLRVSAFGQLHLCLFGVSRLDLRPWLQEEEQQEELKQQIQSSLLCKPQGHDLWNNNPGIRKNLASIGG